MARMLLGVLVIAIAAQAQDTPEAAFARPLAGAVTIAPEEQALEVGIGLPSLLSVAYRHGLRSGLDLGVRGSLTAGLDGMILLLVGSNLAMAPGAKLQGLLALRLAENGRTTLGLTFEPGVFALQVTPVVPNPQPSMVVALTLPVDLRAAVALTDESAIEVSVGAPLWFAPSFAFRVAVPLLAGVGYEQVLGPHTAFVVRARGGVAALLGGGLAPEIDLRGGVAFRW